ncbi:MAG: T9SS type A sorting domain-containing protein [Dysgonamonadaceae bacterium]|nr:T9SS type A sorting domain-containing protein [Dysgonamonadaceae bacterium]
MKTSVLKTGKNAICVAAMMMFTLFTAMADNQTLSISNLTGASAVQNALQNAINAAEGNGIVTVTGTVSGIKDMITLTIPTGVTLKWQASITGDLGSMSYTGKTLLKITGGIMEVPDGGHIEQTGSGSNSTIITSGEVVVSGGTVKNKSGDTIKTSGPSSKVTVSGGTVTSGSSAYGIYASGTSSTVIVSGTGKVSGGSAIWTEGNVEVKENAEVSGSSLDAINAIGTNSKVIVSGGVVKYTGSYANEAINVPNNNTSLAVIVSGTGVVWTAGSGSPAIRTKGHVEVKDNAEVSATTGEAIYAEGASSTVTVSGGKVSATTGYAIRVTGTNSKIDVSGGLVFAYAPAMAVNNDNNFAGVSGTGVVIAWNQKANNTSYFKGSDTDLIMLPAGCARWDKGSDSDGITYGNGANTGFIPIESVTVVAGSGITTPQTALLQLYPNPVTESFRISGMNGKATVTLSDMNGRTVLVQTVEAGESIAVDNLPKGIYLVRVDGKTVKVIKQ